MADFIDFFEANAPVQAAEPTLPEYDSYNLTVSVSRSYSGKPLNKTIARYLIQKALETQQVDFEHRMAVVDLARV